MKAPSVFDNPLTDLVFGEGESGEYDRAKDYLDRAAEAYEGIEVPEATPYTPEYYQYLGDYDPELMQGDYSVDPRLQADTEMRGIQVDPRLKEAQMAALSSLQNIHEGGGMTATERANLARTQNQVATADRGRRDAILQNMQARGMGGSGMELMSQLQSNQAATNRASQQAMDINALAQQRALQAIMDQGTLSGNIRGQDFNEQARKAQAQDEINRFNTNMAARTDEGNVNRAFARDQFNVGTTNQYGSQGHAARQGYADERVDENRRAQGINYDREQQRFDNKIDLAAGKSGAAHKGAVGYGNIGGAKQEQKDRRINTVATGVTDYLTGGKNKKNS